MNELDTGEAVELAKADAAELLAAMGAVRRAARELRLAPNSVSTMVRQLTRDGLLSRGRAESDGRSARLTVTAAGAARVEQWRDIRAELAGRALTRLPLPDQQALRAATPALTRLAGRLEDVNVPAGYPADFPAL